MKKIIFALIAIFLMSGCFNKPEPPKWFTQTKSDTALFLYATGSGSSKKEAIDNALSFAASKVSTTISSSFESQKSMIKSGKYSSAFAEINKVIQTKTKNMEFSDYKIIKEKKVDNKYYVLIQINKPKNGEIIYQKAKTALQSLIPVIYEKDRIRILKTYPNAIKKVNEIISNLYIAKTLNNNLNINPTLQQALKVKSILKQKLNSVSVNVITNNSKLRNTLNEIFTELNIPQSNNGILVLATSKETNTKIMRYYITKLEIHLTLKDQTSLSFDIKCGGKSTTNFAIARDFAYKSCKEKIKEKLKELF